MSIGKWSKFSAWIVVQVLLLYSEDDMVVMSGDVGCWYASFGTLVGVSVLSVFRKSVHHGGHLCMSARVWSVRLHHL